MEVVIRTYIVSYTDVNHRVADANPVKDFGTSRHALLLAATFLIDILLSENEEARIAAAAAENIIIIGLHWATPPPPLIFKTLRGICIANAFFNIEI